MLSNSNCKHKSKNHEICGNIQLKTRYLPLAIMSRYIKQHFISSVFICSFYDASYKNRQEKKTFISDSILKSI